MNHENNNFITNEEEYFEDELDEFFEDFEDFNSYGEDDYDTSYYDDPGDYLDAQGYDADYLDFISDDERWELAMEEGWRYNF